MLRGSLHLVSDVMRNFTTKIEDYVLFHYIHSDLQPIIKGLGSERLTGYNHLNVHSDAQQIRKYRFNMRLSLEFFNAISFLEILLRNSICKSWRIYLGEDFPLIHNNFETKYGYELTSFGAVKIKWDNSTNTFKPISTKQVKNIKEAIKYATKTANKYSRVVTSGDVVANLMFGFWRFCFDPHFKNIMNSQIKWIFPYHDMNKRDPDKVRAKALDYLGKINELRNRIAHHDKIFHMKELREEHLYYILTLIKWIDPKAVKFSNYKTICSLMDSGWSLKKDVHYNAFPLNTF